MTPPARSPRTKSKSKKAPSIFSRDAWSTAHEVAFLRDLGTGAFLGVQYKNGVAPVLAPRMTLLCQYLHAMKFRTDWVDIDSVAVRQAALTMLAHEKERGNLLHATN